MIKKINSKEKYNEKNVKNMIKNEKGITLITLVVTIIALFIVSFTISTNIAPAGETKEYMTMEADITKLREAVNNYYYKNNTLPVLETKYVNVSAISKNPEDDNDYYVIDLNLLRDEFGNVVNIAKGKAGYNNFKDGEVNEDNIYIINSKTHTIYYVAGTVLDGDRYYTLKDY